ncbi:MAG TPA: hypothetical protein VF794_35740 [Archangium sp.]|jgi:hypothetical protein
MCSRPAHLVLLLWGLLVGVWPARAAGAETAQATSQGRIRIQCVPGHVLLGMERETEVRIELEPSATGVELFASRGEVGPLTRVGPGIFRATYVPPRQNLPVVVILAALAQGAQGVVLDGWTELPLWGQGEAEVRTRPGAPVTLQVGSKNYGPISADANGVARIPVAVPPGVHEAFFGRKRIDLGVPPQPFIHAVAQRRELQADREETVDIRLYGMTPEARTQRPPAYAFSASRGTVGAPTEVGPGVSVVRWTVPPGAPGTLELKGSVPGERRWSFTARVSAVPGPARRFEMRVDREVLVASEETRLAVQVSARDAVGNPARVDLRLDSNLGSGVTLTERQVGEYAGVLQLTPSFGGRERLELRLLAEGDSAPVLTRTVALRAAAPARVTVEPLWPFLVADGRSEAFWRISVTDRFGNPVPEPWPEAFPPGAPPSTILSRQAGIYQLRYVPPVTFVDHSSELEVRVGKVSGRGSVSLLYRRPMLMVAPRLGLVTNLADVVAPSAGVRLELWPARPLPDLGVMLDTSYLRASRAGGATVPGFTGYGEWLDVSLALAWRTPPGKRFQGWVAAGPSVTRVRGRSRLAGGPALEEAAWVLGAQAMVGAGIPFGPGLPFLEARFCWFDDPGLHVLRGALRGGGLHLGYRLELF